MDFTLIKKPFLWAAAAAAVLLPAHLAAQVKVGVVNFQQALLATAEMQKEAGKLEQKFAPRQDQIEKLSNGRGAGPGHATGLERAEQMRPAGAGSPGAANGNGQSAVPPGKAKGRPAHPGKPEGTP